MGFRAFRVSKEDGSIQGKLVELTIDDLGEGQVIVDALYSSVNYKDALAATGKGAILKSFPLVAGIDMAGVVRESLDDRFKPGDEVLITGCGLGETHDGGYSQTLRVPADWLVPLPDGLSAWEAMGLGTAGFTAAICVHRMLVNGQVPEMGPIVVTGASGGVGSFAVNIFSSLGFDVLAVSGKPERVDALKALGAAKVVLPDELALAKRPLDKALYGGVVDNVGGAILSGLIPHVQLWGNIASVGLASGPDLKGTVFPHILRGVSLPGD